MIPDEIVIIVRAVLNDNPGNIKVDVGSLSPWMASVVLQAAVDALEVQPEPPIAVVFNDDVVAVTERNIWELEDDDD